MLIFYRFFITTKTRRGFHAASCLRLAVLVLIVYSTRTFTVFQLLYKPRSFFTLTETSCTPDVWNLWLTSGSVVDVI